MQPFERPRFTNALAGSSSPYLRQHAHNPVNWYPWGREAIELAKKENKPILLSVGYSTCYWCHVMEREVFENPSIATLMNRVCINIKLDREEHPHLDEIYMVCRQLLTQQGGWPNNIFLTPDLKPFHAGGTYAPDESQGRPGFPRILEWVNHVWTNQQTEVQEIATRISADMARFLIHTPTLEAPEPAPAKAKKLYGMLEKHHDERAGGFFQSPKFPHESYLEFLLTYYRATGHAPALDMVTRSLSRMAAGGLYDQVGCGFHRYAVDREWYVPHFEKMLYNQAQLARLYTEAAILTGNPYFADIARGTLEFVAGPLTSGNGAFFSAIDAETDGIEGAYYAWNAEELKQTLTEDEIALLTALYALADIPTFPGHKHVDGQVLIARKPLDAAARDTGSAYTELAAYSAEVLNKLLAARNQRKAPNLDDKIIVAWNGLMIDAFAHAGRLLNLPTYTAKAREAADFILEHCIDNTGDLLRIFAGGKARHAATLEDYAYLIKGLISLHRAAPDAELLSSIRQLAAKARALFADEGDNGYFLTQPADDILFRIKTADDSATPGTNGTMLHNLIELHELTGDEAYAQQAHALANYFLRQPDVSPEHCTLIAAALRLDSAPAEIAPTPALRHADGAVELLARFSHVGNTAKVEATLAIKQGWHINAADLSQPGLLPTQLDVRGHGVEVLKIDYPPATLLNGQPVYTGSVTATLYLKLPDSPQKPALRVLARFQPCTGTSCHMARDLVITI